MTERIPEITRDEIKKAIAVKLGTADFKLDEYKIRPASDNPMGFLGEHVRVSAKVNMEDKQKDIHLFVKKIPSTVDAHYDYAVKTKAFYKEIELYRTLLKDITNAISKTRKTKKWLPEFYYARDWDLFVVEDLSVDGFYMLPDRAVMDEEHLKLAVEAMAIMHAGSFIFEEKLNNGKATTLSNKHQSNRKSTIGELYDNLTFETEASDIKGHPGNTFWEAGIRSEVRVIDVLPDYTDGQRKIIKENLVGKLRQILQYVKPSDRFKNVLLHGDLWSNNLMFRKNEKGVVTDAIILDYQLGRYGPPAHDLMMFFYLTQTRDLRSKRESMVMDLYYSTLKREILAEGLDAEKLYPLAEFKESIEYYREYAVINNVVYYQLIFAPAEICAKFLSSVELFKKNFFEDRSEMVLTCFREDAICRQRMTEAVREMAEMYKWV